VLRLKFDFDDGLFFQFGEKFLKGFLHFFFIVVRLNARPDLLKRKRFSSFPIEKFEYVETQIGSNDSTHRPDLKAGGRFLEGRKEVSSFKTL